MRPAFLESKYGELDGQYSGQLGHLPFNVEGSKVYRREFISIDASRPQVFGLDGDIKPHSGFNTLQPHAWEYRHISGQHAMFQYRKKGDWLDMLNLSSSHVWYSSKVTKPRSKSGKFDVYVIQETGWYIKDVNSTNGTKVNGELLPAQNNVDDLAERYKLQREAIANVKEVGQLLKSGDLITIADVEYCFVLSKE